MSAVGGMAVDLATASESFRAMSYKNHRLLSISLVGGVEAVHLFLSRSGNSLRSPAPP
jgi:hypothetical protein